MSDQQMKEGAPVVQQELIRVPASAVAMGLMPRSLDEGIKLATLLARSTFVPADFQGRPENIIVALQMGAEVGLAPMQALQSIAVINGRPSIWGDGLLALVMASGHYENHEEAFDETTQTATATFKRKGKATAVTATFSKTDAEKAKLWGKGGPWTNYPKRMMQMRARAFAIRDCFPDVLKGLGVAEEQLDIPASEAARAIVAAAAPAAAVAHVAAAATSEVVEAEAPDGYDECLSDLQAAADEGSDAVQAAFQAAPLEYRTRLTGKDAAIWNAIKERAAATDARKQTAAANEQASASSAPTEQAKSAAPTKPAIDPDDPFELGKPEPKKKGGR